MLIKSLPTEKVNFPLSITGSLEIGLPSTYSFREETAPSYVPEIKVPPTV